MEINGILCKMIFEHNKDAHEFFVEESYVINWMYPYLEPCGLIMKLNKQPLDKLDEGTVRRDTEFWRDTVGRLLKHPGFATNEAAMKTFSKLRSGIAGIYVHRKMIAEAEHAFREALRLYPASPEANYRLAKMYEEQGKIGEARALIEKYAETLDTPDAKKQAANYLKTLENNRELTADEKKRLEALVGQLGAADPRMRGAARKEMEAFGARMLPFLKQHLQADDPEVSTVIRTLVRQLEKQSNPEP
jgi:tetratricopeptide (TPR) repeat protein